MSCGYRDENNDTCGYTFTCALCRKDADMASLLIENKELREAAKRVQIVHEGPPHGDTERQTCRACELNKILSGLRPNYEKENQELAARIWGLNDENEAMREALEAIAGDNACGQHHDAMAQDALKKAYESSERPANEGCPVEGGVQRTSSKRGVPDGGATETN